MIEPVCRALGIPARPVSNLVSAHDANGTLTIDRYYDAKNNELNYDPFNPDGGADSIWNFHVWVEAWMARPDLPKGKQSDCYNNNNNNDDEKIQPRHKAIHSEVLKSICYLFRLRRMASHRRHAPGTFIR